MSNLGSFEFWQMFHSLLRHGDQPEDVEHAQATFLWFSENIHQFRRVIKDPTEVDLIGVLWKLAAEGKQMPSYGVVKDHVKGMQQNDGMCICLEEYEDPGLQGELIAFAIPDMPSALRRLADRKEQNHVNWLAKAMVTINGTGWEDPTSKPRVKLIGPRDAIKFAVREMEKGIFIDDRQSSVYVVNNEADSVLDEYDRMCREPWYDVGIPQVKLEAGDVMGILGYKGGCKTTLSRFCAYNVAQAGHTVLHIAVENSMLRRDIPKYIFIHSQNPKFHGKYDHLKWTDYVDRNLSQNDKRALKVVAEDFTQTFAGKLILKEPSAQTWAAVKTMIELQAMSEPVHVVLLDYIQLLTPPHDKSMDDRARVTEMVREIRQFAKTMGIVIISPVQANEAGLKYAGEHEGRYPISGVLNDKELTASMTHLISVFDMDATGNGREVVIASQKDRDRGPFKPETWVLHPAGWWSPLGRESVVTPERGRTAVDRWITMNEEM